MNLFSSANLKIFALILFAISIKLFFDHRKPNYKGMYREDSSYSQITALKHDVTKVLFTELFPLLVFGLSTGDAFWNTEDPLNSWLGKTAIYTTGYFIFYELLQPYISNRIPYYAV